MKKTLAFLLSLGLTVSMLAGCGSKTNETTAATEVGMTDTPIPDDDDTYMEKRSSNEFSIFGVM